MNTRFLYFLALLAISSLCSAQSQNTLFIIEDEGKYGYIDKASKVVIPPQFLSAGEFSQGLAVARLKGSYGYINQQGNFVIPPQYDYAADFSEGLALVFVNGRYYFIDRTGNKLFDAPYRRVTSFKNGIAKVINASRTVGYIDKKGKLMVDTLFYQIKPFSEGMSAAYGYYYKEQESQVADREKLYGTAVIDSLGNFAVPHGKFSRINSFNEGYAKATFGPMDNEQHAVIDRKGNITVAIDPKQGYNGYMEDRVSGTIIKLTRYAENIKLPSGKYLSYKSSYVAYMNLKGEVFFSDTDYRSGEHFFENRAFIQDRSGRYDMINTKGKKVNAMPYNGIIKPGFKNGKALVLVDTKWALIDTSGNYLIPPTFSGIDPIGIVDNYFFFKGNDSLSSSMNYGVAGLDGKIWITPVMSSFDKSGFHGDLLQCMMANKKTYVNRKGEIAWQQKEVDTKDKTDKLPALNISSQRQACYSESSHSKDNRVNVLSSTIEHQNLKNKSLYPSDELSIRVDTKAKDTFAHNYQGYKVYVANTTSKEALFSTTSGYISISVQALNKQGEWKDLEYSHHLFTITDCGLPHGYVTLWPDKCIKFTIPVYEGGYSTKLRVAIIKKEGVLYSDPFTGSINGGQFWRKNQIDWSGVEQDYTDLPD